MFSFLYTSDFSFRQLSAASNARLAVSQSGIARLEHPFDEAELSGLCCFTLRVNGGSAGFLKRAHDVGY